MEPPRGTLPPSAVLRPPFAERLNPPLPAALVDPSDDYGSPLHPAFMTEIFND